MTYLVLGPPALEGEDQPPRALPLLGFEIEDAAVRRVVEGYTISQALQPLRLILRLEDEEFLLDRPPMLAALARRLHKGLEPYKVTVRENEPGHYDVEDPGVLRGSVRLVASAPGRRVYFAQGDYRALANLLHLTGAMVVTLRYRQGEDPGEPTLVNEQHLYIRIDNVVVHGLLKVLSPLIHAIINKRAANGNSAAEELSIRVTKDPAGLYMEMKDWPEITQEQRREFGLHFGIAED